MNYIESGTDATGTPIRIYYNDYGTGKPVILIHGDADQTVPIGATAEEAVKAIPNSRLIVYEGAPHGLFYTDRNRLNKDLLAFLSE